MAPSASGFLNHDTGISTFDIQTGDITGVLTDYVVYATNCLGDNALHFDLHGFDTQLEQLQALQNDEIDLIFHTSQNPSAAAENGLALSNHRLELQSGGAYHEELF